MLASRIFNAEIQNLPELVLFLEGLLKEAGTLEEESFDIQLAADEIFTNIANYAYGKGDGEVEIALFVQDDLITITFTDSGIPFNPLTLPTPDITLGIDERKIGGLGIHLVRELMDTTSYLRENGKNILTIEKRRVKKRG
jgi:Anti-sigma regulatory factor (Ser/Thr protein kinase)